MNVIPAAMASVPHIKRRTDQFRRCAGAHYARLDEAAKDAVIRLIWGDIDNRPFCYTRIPEGWKHHTFTVDGQAINVCRAEAVTGRPFKGYIVYLAGLNSRPCDNDEFVTWLNREGYTVFEFDLVHPNENQRYVEISAQMVRQVLTNPYIAKTGMNELRPGYPVNLVTHSTSGMLKTEQWMLPLPRSAINRNFIGVNNMCSFFNSPATRPGTWSNHIYRELYVPHYAGKADFGSLWLDIMRGVIHYAQGERLMPTPKPDRFPHESLNPLFDRAQSVHDRLLKRSIPYNPERDIPVTYISASQDPSADPKSIARISQHLGVEHKEMPGRHWPVHDARFQENRECFLAILDGQIARWRERRLTSGSAAVLRHQAA